MSNMENNLRNQKFCTQCPRQCPIDQLNCGRGRSYFGGEGTESLEDGHGYGGTHGEHGEEHRGRHGRRGDECFEKGTERRCGRRHRGNHEKGHHDCHDGVGRMYHNMRGYEVNLEEASLSQLLCRSGFIAGHKSERQGGQGRILSILVEQGDMNQKNLREMLEIEPGSLSELLTKLEAKGLLERTEDENDRRCQIVHLTDAGKELVEKKKGSEGKMKDIFHVLTEEEKVSLRNILIKLLTQWRVEYRNHRK